MTTTHFTTEFPTPAARVAVSYMPADARTACRAACNARIDLGVNGNEDEFLGAVDVLTALIYADEDAAADADAEFYDFNSNTVTTVAAFIQAEDDYIAEYGYGHNPAADSYLDS